MSVRDNDSLLFPPFPPAPDKPGWLIAGAEPTGRFADIFGPILLRIEEDGRIRCRFRPEPRHRNVLETIHGGFAMAVVDQVIFIGPHARGVPGALGGVTIDASMQFVAPIAIAPFDAVVEILRETGRMVFMRGLIEQDGATALAFSGTIRKASPRG